MITCVGGNDTPILKEAKAECSWDFFLLQVFLAACAQIQLASALPGVHILQPPEDVSILWGEPKPSFTLLSALCVIWVAEDNKPWESARRTSLKIDRWLSSWRQWQFDWFSKAAVHDALVKRHGILRRSVKLLLCWETKERLVAFLFPTYMWTNGSPQSLHFTILTFSPMLKLKTCMWRC